MNKRTKLITEIGIILALTSVLEIIFSNTQIVLFPNGGSISIAVLPIMILALRHGFFVGTLTGLVFGVFQFILPNIVYFLNPIQYVFDYIIPFTVLGVLGLVKKVNFKNVVIYSSLAMLLKYVSHVISGIAYYSSYAPEGFDGVTWSFYYNATYMVPTWILVSVLLGVIFTNYSKYLLQK